MRLVSVFSASILAWLHVSVLAQPVPASASDKTPSKPPLGVGSIGVAAMPGGLHVAAASLSPKGTVSVYGVGGYGRRGGLLGGEHVLNRFVGGFAVSYTPIDRLMIGFTTDGRFDTHSGTGVSEQGLVSEPRLFLRGGSTVGAVALGAQLSLLIPGRGAPSLVFPAATVEGRALASIAAGPATVSINAGFRLDRTYKTLVDEDGDAVSQASFTREDQVSLGISKYNAGVAGVHAYIPLGKAYVGAEASADLFIGREAGKAKPGPTIRGGLSGGFQLAKRISAFAYVEGSKIGKISLAANAANLIPLVPYETTFTVGLGVFASFGGPSRARSTILVVAVKKCQHPDDPQPNNPDDRDCPPKVAATALLIGLVNDDVGQPVVAAKVEVQIADKMVSAVTDANGTFSIGDLPLGAAQVTIEAAGKKPFKVGHVLVAGTNKPSKIALETLLPPGELRGVVRSQKSGKPLAASIVVAATAKTAVQTVQTEADGTFVVALPPGTYSATVTSDGMAPQTLSVVIEANGVAIKNVDLRKK
ncbi:MAG: carboxypeptidase regulatory-like domain-containing protein [Kofleriaceae bacterium]|nr:carboxypeptidase regulatory-like domain-containing protein [Kofleriaceae bacterium]